MRNKVNRIPIFFAALFTSGMGGYLISWSYFRDSLGQLFPTWTQTQLSLPFSLHNITVFVMMLTTGLLLKKLSNRVVLGIGGLAILIGFGLFPYLPLDNPLAALVMAVICFSFIAALSVGIGVIASFDTFLPWFPDRLGLISGILTFFCGVAPILLGALCGVFIDQFGVLRAIQLIGIILAVIIFLSLIWAQKPSPDIELPPAPREKVSAGVDYSPKEMLITGSFWCLLIFNIAIRSAGIVISDLGGTIAITLGVATLSGLLFAPANGLACILGGYLLDRLSVPKVMTFFGVFLLLGGILLFFGNQAGSKAMVITGISCVGFTYGGVTVTSVTGTRMLFGMKHYALNLGLVSISIGPATVACIFAGKLTALAGGAYNLVFAMILILGIVAALSSLIMFRTERFRQRKQPNFETIDKQLTIN